MKSETRRKIADTVAAVLTVGLLAAALWLVRCSTTPQPAYYAPDPAIVRPDTIPDSVAMTPKKKTKEQKKKHTPRQRDYLDEPVDR